MFAGKLEQPFSTKPTVVASLALLLCNLYPQFAGQGGSPFCHYSDFANKCVTPLMHLDLEQKTNPPRKGMRPHLQTCVA